MKRFIGGQFTGYRSPIRAPNLGARVIDLAGLEG